MGEDCLTQPCSPPVLYPHARAQLSSPGVGSVVVTVVVMMVDVVVSWLSSDTEACTSLSELFVGITAAPAGAAVGASPSSPVLSGKGWGRAGGSVEGEICSVGRLVVAWSPQGSSGGLCSVSSAGTRSPGAAVGSLELLGLAGEAVPGGPARVGFSLGCFLPVFTCFRVGGFFLTGEVCLASGLGAAVAIGGSGVVISAGVAPSCGAGRRLRAVPCLSSPSAGSELMAFPKPSAPAVKPVPCPSSAAPSPIFSSTAGGSGLAGTSTAPDPLSAKNGKAGLGQSWARN